MKIDSIELFLVKNPLKTPWRTAYGEDSETFSVITKIISEQFSGWSESSPLYGPTYSPEHAFGTFHFVEKFIAPLIVGKRVETAQEIISLMDHLKGNPFAKSAIEIAWWMLKSSIEEKPLHSLIGGSYKKIDVGADIGVQDSIDILLGRIEHFVQLGVPRIKLKAKRGWDVDMLRAVRSTFPKMTFHIDCNGSYTLEDIQVFKEIDKFQLAMIEQPLHHQDIVDHAKLQKAIDTPICLDESVTSPMLARQAIEIGACKYINLKPGRLGGIYNTILVNKICEEAGIGCWIGSMLETALGNSICIELASLPNMTYPSDLFPSAIFYEEELTTETIVFENNSYTYPCLKPGNPRIPDPLVLSERTIKRAYFHDIS